MKADRANLVQSPDTLAQMMGITDTEIARRKEWLEFTEEDVQRIASISDFARQIQDEVIDGLYTHFLAFDEVRAFFKDSQILERVKALQKAYFIRLTQGSYDRAYVEERINIGSVHGRIGLDTKWYLGAYNFHMRAIARRIFVEFAGEPEKALEIFLSLVKLEFFDIGLALDTIFAQREHTIRQQQDAIRELSTPVLQVRDRLLILPIIGMIDTLRARQLTEQLLRSIRDTRARVVVMDITGVPAVDSRVANHLIQTVDASRLMGAIVIVTGLSAEVAQTLVTLGVDLSKLNTVGDLQGGIEQAERILGYRVIQTEVAAAPFAGA
ncbi:MAG TPA: protoglobin domain-containing protein [Chthonomonadaceae bacterium]|nr:protoglobin domain-containing protein [Chthonomonadaceae bacterium]